MRVVIQRVSEASVSIDGVITAKINAGLLLLCGFENEDNNEDLEWTASKIVNMRIFSDSEGKMNLSVVDIKGDLLVVSQFTLFAQTKKGNRPGFTRAAKPEISIPLYEQFKLKLAELTFNKVESGTFGADMQIELINDGPVTVILDSKQKE